MGVVTNYLAEVSDEKKPADTPQTAKEYVTRMKKPSTWGDFLCLLESRHVIRRRVLNVYFRKLDNGSHVVVDSHLPNVVVIDKSTMLIGFFASHYYALRVVETMLPNALVLNSTAGRKYEIGFVKADGNCLFRSLVVACDWAQVQWHIEVDVGEDKLLQIKDQKFIPFETVLKMEYLPKDREMLFLGYQIVNYDYMILSWDRSINEPQIFNLDECMTRCRALGKYTISKEEKVQLDVQLQKMTDSLSHFSPSNTAVVQLDDSGTFKY